MLKVSTFLCKQLKWTN